MSPEEMDQPAPAAGGEPESPPPPPPPPPPEGPGTLPDPVIPWERGKGALAGLPVTFKLVMFRPGATFRASPKNNWLQPLAFAVLVTLAVAALAALTGLAASVIPWVAVLVFMPLNALIIHTALWAMGSAKEGLGATFRVSCYALAPVIFTLIPVAGGWIFTVWNVAIMTLGLAAAHRAKVLFSFIANLVPVTVFLLLEHFLPKMLGN